MLSRPRQRKEKFKTGLDFSMRPQWTNPCDSARLRAPAQDNLHNLAGLYGEVALHFELGRGQIEDGNFVIDPLTP